MMLYQFLLEFYTCFYCRDPAGQSCHGSYSSPLTSPLTLSLQWMLICIHHVLEDKGG